MAEDLRNPQDGGPCGIDSVLGTSHAPPRGLGQLAKPSDLGGRPAEPWGKDRMSTPSGEDRDQLVRGQPSETYIRSLTPGHRGGVGTGHRPSEASIPTSGTPRPQQREQAVPDQDRFRGPGEGPLEEGGRAPGTGRGSGGGRSDASSPSPIHSFHAHCVPITPI